MKTQRLAMALAAASLCSVAGAQTVQIYGKLYPYLHQESGSGASAVGTPVSSLAAPATGVGGITTIRAMSAANSNIGFRGREDLGDGLAAVFQLEGVVAVDTGGAGGFSWNRNTFVGLEGKFGAVRLGNMDTIFKNYGDTLGFLSISSGTFLSTSDLMRKTGFGISSASSFHLRRSNSIQYETPEIAGLQAGLQYSTNEAPLGTRDPKVYSLGIKYDAGPIYLALAHEIHNDLFGGSANAPAAQRNNAVADTVNSKDKATQFTVEWRPVKEHRLEFDVIRKTYNENSSVTGRFQSYKNTAYMFAIDSRWNASWRSAVTVVKSTSGSCSRVATACSTDGLDGTKLTVGGAYYFSRRTYLFGAYDQIKNGFSARYNNAEFVAPNPGEDVRHLMLGLAHNF